MLELISGVFLIAIAPLVVFSHTEEIYLRSKDDSNKF